MEEPMEELRQSDLKSIADSLGKAGYEVGYHLMASRVVQLVEEVLYLRSQVAGLREEADALENLLLEQNIVVFSDRSGVR